VRPDRRRLLWAAFSRLSALFGIAGAVEPQPKACARLDAHKGLCYGMRAEPGSRWDRGNGTARHSLHRLAAATGTLAGSRTLTVFAASSLTDAFQDMKPAFERAHPGVTVRFSFASSATLRTQIEQGAPADVFASADVETMQPLVKAKLVGTPAVFARNRVALVIPKANPAGLKSAADLARPGVRIVAASENVPIWRYTAMVLDYITANRFKEYPDNFARRVVQNIRSREPNVRSVLTKVEMGEADAGFVYQTDAAASTRVATLPFTSTALAEYPIAAVRSARNRDDGKAFVRYVLSHDGQTFLRKRGFVKP